MMAVDKKYENVYKFLESYSDYMEQELKSYELLNTISIVNIDKVIKENNIIGAGENEDDTTEEDEQSNNKRIENVTVFTF